MLTPGVADGTGGHSGARCTGFDGATRGSALAGIGSWAAVGRVLDVAVGDGFAMVALAAEVVGSAGSGPGVTLDRGLAPAAIVAKAAVAVTFGATLGVKLGWAVALMGNFERKNPLLPFSQHAHSIRSTSLKGNRAIIRETQTFMRMRDGNGSDRGR